MDAQTASQIAEDIWYIKTTLSLIQAVLVCWLLAWLWRGKQ